jgi:hypothetical protein
MFQAILIFSLVIGSVFFSTDAFATNHPKSCVDLRDLTCKPFWPGADCEKLYQYAVAHNGTWKYSGYDRRSNSKLEQVTNCIP